MPHNPTRERSSRVNLENLEPEHYATLGRAISTILSTKLATETFAQVVDGIPTCNVYKEYYGYRRKDFSDNISPGQPALQAVESYRRNFNISLLQVDTKVLVNNSLPLIPRDLSIDKGQFRSHRRIRTPQEDPENLI